MKGEDKDVQHHYHYYGVDPATLEGANGAANGGPAPARPIYGAARFAPPAVNRHRHPGADSLVKGLIIGAGAAYLATNEKAQRTILRSAVQLWTTLRGSVEEFKERFHDAEAEVASPPEVLPETPPAES
ncbi:conserved hypothetical protein [Methylocella silvestris BL2]|uniref:YtxH domain-containing protein n=1 Tax=Methylocella silvestris (strain DSM 15510 / CIP 108128 / LMG 27833 / NCIMB 13906 / BL2) TaxID=395965 RepID=B8EIK5_METSB|nr:hypothetical protein [Methylocella silvestris]ACK51822.1 conserved hypothetical protein [Methylocella silvestris BL2]